MNTNNNIKETAAAVLSEYRTNEDNNFHTENLLLLAENFGTDDEIKLVKMRLRSMNSEYDVPDYLVPNKIQRKINSYYSTLVTLAK